MFNLLRLVDTQLTVAVGTGMDNILTGVHAAWDAGQTPTEIVFVQKWLKYSLKGTYQHKHRRMANKYAVVEVSLVIEVRTLFWQFGQKVSMGC